MNERFEEKQLHEVAQEMHNWLISYGCNIVKDDHPEIWFKCPDNSCSSHEKEHHQAFSINIENANYACFHCGLGGCGLGGPRGLLTQLGIETYQPAPTTKNQPKKRKTPEKYEPVADFTKAFEALPEFPEWTEEAQKYWTETRGLNQETAFSQGGLGVRLYNKDTNNLPFGWKGDLIVFPHRWQQFVTGKVCYISGVAVPNSEKCYPRRDKAGRKLVYITPFPGNAKFCCLTESNLDAASIFETGYQCIAFGQAKLSEIMLPVIKNRIEDTNIVIVFDNDKTGVESAKALAEQLWTSSMPVESINIAHIPQETVNGKVIKDANDVLKYQSRAKLQELIQQSEKIYPAAESVIKGESTVSEEPVENTPDAEVKEKQPQKELTEKKKRAVVSSQVKTASQTAEIVFPECAWRGVFSTYRQAQEGTTEASDHYHFAIFKTIAGAVIGRSCWLWNGRYLYPNFYTVLIGPTKKSRKTTAKSRGEALLEDTDPLVITQSGLATPEGLIGRLMYPSIDELDGLPEIEKVRAVSVSEHEGYRMLVICNEFASLLKKAKKESGSGLIQVLTDAYDCQSSLDNPTLTRPLSARNPFIAMIGLSTKEWLETNLDTDDIHGGFVNRNTFYLWTKTEPLYNPSEPDALKLNQIKQQLHKIRAAKSGKHEKYTFSQKADAILKEWYEQNYYTEYESEIVDAVVQRVDENVRKLALLYAVLENEPDDTEIHTEQLQAAMSVGEYWEATAIEIFSKFGATRTTRDEMRIIEALRKTNKPITRRTLHQKFGSSMSAKQLNDALKNLVTMERIEPVKVDYTDNKGKKKYRDMLRLSVE